VATDRSAVNDLPVALAPWPPGTDISRWYGRWWRTGSPATNAIRSSDCPLKAALYRVPAQLARGVSIESADRQSLLTPEG
jgi:hypothetical protein